MCKCISSPVTCATESLTILYLVFSLSLSCLPFLSPTTVPFCLTHFLSPHANGQPPSSCRSNQKSIKNTSPPSLQSPAWIEAGREKLPALSPCPSSSSSSELSITPPLSSALLSTGSWQHDLRERRT